MAMNANKIVVAILAVLQVSCAVARRHVDADEIIGRPPLAASRSSGGGGISAVMTVNGFRRGEGGGGPAACDEHFHGDDEMIAALSTRWYANGQRCHEKILITSVRNGRSVEAIVVDECDSRHGCKNNIVDTSKAVWEALGLDTNIGEVPVTWSDA
ncbi:hypothetical protein QOZ80_2BG0184100 [Eleusine coracana subsp. coracana]|nr:hypothetical protein QOZ80_2BG0184100 [Eleusine coracana subsp. coracana]